MLIEKITVHPLKDIVLKYDDQKEVTEFERDLLKDYVKLHDGIYRFYPERDKLLDTFKKIDGEVANGEKEFDVVSKTIFAFHERAKKMIDEQSVSRIEITKLMKDLERFFPKISKFHEENLIFISKTVKALDEEKEAYIMDHRQAHLDYLNYYKKSAELKERFDNLSLDKESYNVDYQKFTKLHDKDNIDAETWTLATNVIMERQNDLMNNSGKMYVVFEELKEMITTLQLAEHLFDSSLSDSFRGINDAPGRPKYFLLPGDKKIKEYEDLIHNLCKPEVHTITISVPVYAVEQGYNCALGEIVLALQHYPLLIEKSLFLFDFAFEEIEGSTLLLQDNDWRGNPLFTRWFNSLIGMPFLYFFIHDRDARGYFIMGDLLADGKINPSIVNNEQSRNKVTVSGENIQELANRVVLACETFMIYCHNTGFDPQLYIEGVLAEFDLGITYNQIKERYLQSIESGIEFRAFTGNPDEGIV